MSERWLEINHLYKNRSRNRITEISWLLVSVIFISPWLFYGFSFQFLFEEQRRINAKRFLSEIVPYPIQQNGFSWSDLFSWLSKLFAEKGFEAVEATLAISVISIVLASLTAFCLSIFASRRLFYIEQTELGRKPKLSSRFFIGLIRVFALFFRAIPEYVWAFIFVMLLGVSIWAGIIALAIHNCGILTKLFSESLDDLPQAPLTAIRRAGASPLEVGTFVGIPMSLNRFLLFLFVRWETCVRESTVIGFLGIVSIGYWIEDARARNFYDELFFFVFLGTILVLFGDIISSITRARLR